MRAQVAAVGRRFFLPPVGALLLGLAGSVAHAAIEDAIPAAPDRYVTDRAGVLPSDRAESLNARLAEFERETSDQILVWIDRRVPEGFALEDFTVRAAQKWAVGQRKKSNGIVLFVFTEDRKMRIEVGYGLEGVLPDVLAHRIQEEEIRPRLRQGDYAGGVEAGAAAMIAATRGEYKGTGSTVSDRQRGKRRSIDSLAGCIVPFLFFFLAPFLFRSRWRTYGSGGWRVGGGLGGWGSGGGWGGSSGGGGFSGGGGSFGGGGSSGSW
ncbi:MAG: TPM domain-containing protein [Thermoanaerobaculia bacterium]